MCLLTTSTRMSQFCVEVRKPVQFWIKESEFKVSTLLRAKTIREIQRLFVTIKYDLT